MSVLTLTTHNFRNLVSGEPLNFHPELNFIIGDNGSGKSSLLESLFFLGHGKSFRTTKVDNLVTNGNTNFVVSVKDSKDVQLGLSRDVSLGLTNIKINGQRYSKLSDLAQNIAVQIITPESFKLFFGGPKERRRFIDLGMFHVKHNFYNQWKEFTKILKQRNACIRNTVKNKAVLSYWTNLFCEHSLLVANERQEYVNALTLELSFWLQLLLPKLSSDVSVQYSRGWNQKKDLAVVLTENEFRETNFGYSLYGAHKFDVKFLIDKQPLENQLSRGQQKLFLLALTFAQAKLISKKNRVKPILLIDDVGAELDINSRKLLAQSLAKLDCQIVITAIEKQVLLPLINTEDNVSNGKGDKYKLFHVKHGKVVPMVNSVLNSTNSE